MNNKKMIPHIKKEDIKNFIHVYISEYRRFLEENYPHRKNDFPLYTGYPLDVKVYLSKRSTYIAYKFNAPSLKIEVIDVDHVPDWKEMQRDTGEEYSNIYLSRIINKPQDVAKRRVLEVFDYEKQQEELHDWLYEEYIKSTEAEKDATIEGYLAYLESAYDAKKKTYEEKRNEIYSAINLLNKHSNCYSAYVVAGCGTFSDVMLELNQDIDSSIFLSIHGKYRPANALLRRWLETAIYALYFDSELKNHKHDNSAEKYNKILEKRNKWLENKFRHPFTGNAGILAKLIGTETEIVATSLLKETTSYFTEPSFRICVETLYGDLSRYVHYDGISPSEDDQIPEFAKYKENLFDQWYMKLNQINEICNILTLLKFPEMFTLSKEYKDIEFPTLKEDQMQKLKKLLKK